jgi:hypothetical protein
VRYSFAPILEVQAREIAGWRYEGEYALYNPDPPKKEEVRIMSYEEDKRTS